MTGTNLDELWLRAFEHINEISNQSAYGWGNQANAIESEMLELLRVFGELGAALGIDLLECPVCGRDDHNQLKLDAAYNALEEAHESAKELMNEISNIRDAIEASVS